MPGLGFVRRRALFIGTIVPFLIFGLVLSQPAQAVSNTGPTFTTSPVSVDLSTSPGSTTSTVLQIQNNSSQPINENVKLEEFRASGDSGQAQLFQPPAGDTSTSWVHFSKTAFVAQPGVWTSITMTIQVPKTAAFGYYYAVLFAPSTTVAGKNNESFKGDNAVLVLLNATAPNENNTLSVKSFTASKSSYQYLPASFSVTIHNSGNVFTVPRGDIFISRTPNGPVINSIDLNSGGGNILPQTDRTFVVQWTNGFPVYQPKLVNGQSLLYKNGKPVEQLKWDFTKVPEFRYGKYYARLVLVYNNGSGDEAVKGLLSFWVVPWSLIFSAIGTVIAIIVLWEVIKRLSRRLRKRVRR